MTVENDIAAMLLCLVKDTRLAVIHAEAMTVSSEDTMTGSNVQSEKLLPLAAVVAVTLNVIELRRKAWKIVYKLEKFLFTVTEMNKSVGTHI
jgi:hypothetical protein